MVNSSPKSSASAMACTPVTDPKLTIKPVGSVLLLYNRYVCATFDREETRLTALHAAFRGDGQFGANVLRPPGLALVLGARPGDPPEPLRNRLRQTKINNPF